MPRSIRTYLLSLLVVSAIAVTPAFAKGGSGTINLHDKVSIGGTELGPGEYKIKWDDNGEVAISQGKTVVAKTQATVQQSPRATGTQIITSGSKVTSIQLENNKQTIVFEGGAAKSAN